MAEVGLRVNEASHLDLADVKWDGVHRLSEDGDAAHGRACGPQWHVDMQRAMAVSAVLGRVSRRPG
jgi:hypothetical protein